MPQVERIAKYQHATAVLQNTSYNSDGVIVLTSALMLIARGVL